VGNVKMADISCLIPSAGFINQVWYIIKQCWF